MYYEEAILALSVSAEHNAVSTEYRGNSFDMSL